MKIAIDIDDTIMDTFDYLMPYVAEYYNVDIKELKKRNISYSNLPKEWKTKEIEFCKKYYDKVVPDTPVKPDAAKYIKLLKQSGHSVFIVTARDDRLYTNAYKTTQEQLMKNGIVYDKLICAFDKTQACVDEGVNLFIDDSIQHCKNVSEKGIRTILFNSKANINCDVQLNRVDTWEELFKMIKGM